VQLFINLSQGRPPLVVVTRVTEKDITCS